MLQERQERAEGVKILGREGVSSWVPWERLSFGRRKDIFSLHISMEGDADRFGLIWWPPLSQWGQGISCKREEKGVVEKRDGKKELVYRVVYLSRSSKGAAGMGVVCAQHPSTQHTRCWQSMMGIPPPRSPACVSSLPLWHLSPLHHGEGAGGCCGWGVTCPPLSPVLFWIYFPTRALFIDYQDTTLKKGWGESPLNINCVFLFIFLQRELPFS